MQPINVYDNVNTTRHKLTVVKRVVERVEVDPVLNEYLTDDGLVVLRGQM